MRNTENRREGMMSHSQRFIKEFEEYKKHSNHLKQIKKAFEDDGHRFDNMEDVRNILLLLSPEITEVSFIDDSSDSNVRELKPNIFDNSFFKPF